MSHSDEYESEPETIQAPKSIPSRKAKPQKIKEIKQISDDEDELLFDIDPPEPPPKRGKGRPRKPIEEVDPDEIPKPKRIQSKNKRKTLRRLLKHENETLKPDKKRDGLLTKKRSCNVKRKKKKSNEKY